MVGSLKRVVNHSNECPSLHHPHSSSSSSSSRSSSSSMGATSHEESNQSIAPAHPYPLDVGLEVHEVILPSPRSSWSKFGSRFKETFFPDDPLRQFKGQPAARKWLLGLQYLFPILQWAPNYSLSLFKSDIVSGLTIASLAIPQGISYAKLANLPPILGLYSSFVPPLVYAVLGSSRDLAVGPVSIASLILGSLLRQEVSPTKEPALFLRLAFTTTFFAGLFQASLGILRLGFIIDYLSKPTLVGFMAGSAVIVSLQQLKGLLGITDFTKKMGLVPVMSSVFFERNEGSVRSIRKPKLFWVSAGAPLVSVILATVLIFSFKGQKHGIGVIGKLPHGLNPPSWMMLGFQGDHVILALKTGIITGVISLTVRATTLLCFSFPFFSFLPADGI
ncbi:putative sulfate transporter 3.3 [Asimina triloba]